MYRHRQLWIKIHVYVALLLGLMFALTGISGSLCVYADELNHWLHPQFNIQPQGSPQSPDKLLAAVRAAQPDRHGVWVLELPRTPEDVAIAWFEKPKESVDAFYAPLMVAINPYTAEVISSELWGDTLITQIKDLHTQWQYEAAGRNIQAGVAIAMLVSVISGIYLWWPGWRQWRRWFTVRVHSGLMRLLFDLHRLIGFFSAALLLLLAFTGFHLAYPLLLEQLTASQGMGHGDAGPTVRSTAVPNNRPISLAEAVLVARGLFPSSEVRRISTPLGDSGTYKINLRQRDEVNQHHPFTTVWIDRWSGQIRDVRNPHRFTTAQSFTVWLWPLHTGEAFGELGRFLWFMAGLTPAILYVSGLWHWLYRQGLVKDRAIDYPGMQRRCLRLGKKLHARLAQGLSLALEQYRRWR